MGGNKENKWLSEKVTDMWNKGRKSDNKGNR